MFQAHFLVEIAQGGLGAPGVLTAPVHEEAYGDAAKHAQDPGGVAMADSDAILVGADVQTLMQSRFDAPIIALPRQPLVGGQALGLAAAQQVLRIRMLAQALSQNEGALGRSRKTGLFRVNDRGAKSADFCAAPIGLWPRMRPIGRQGCRRGKKAAPVGAAVGRGSGAVLSGWP